MKKPLACFALISLLFSSVLGDSYTDSLADCTSLASLFNNTCTSTTTQLEFSAVPSKSVTCPNVGTCAGSGNSTKCTFERKLCVTCYTYSNTVYIRVQTNNMPSHCYTVPMGVPEAQTIDFSVKWNWDVGSKYYKSVSSQSVINTILCEIDEPSTENIPDDANFTNRGDYSLFSTTGILLSGNGVFSSVTGEKVDPFFPAVYGQVTNTEDAKEMVDQCLSHPEMEGVYHSHGPNPCFTNSSYYQQVIECNDDANCKENPITFAIKQYGNNAAWKKQKAVGIAKDGHIIWGPYNNDGELWGDCEVDICNGLKIDGYYGYVATSWHPYMVGCFGPAKPTNLVQECSENPRQCDEDVENSGGLLLEMGLLLILSMILMFA